MLSQPVRLGDYVQLEDGSKGYVRNIGWRETRIETLGGNLLVIPNGRLAQSALTNFSMAESHCTVEGRVSYAADLDRVELIATGVARQVLAGVQGADPADEPIVRFHTFAKTGVNFTVILTVPESADDPQVIHTYIKALHTRFRHEGIEFFTPQFG
jgi:small-conductance mechanosensitive channel